MKQPKTCTQAIAAQEMAAALSALIAKPPRVRLRMWSGAPPE
ncbi:MAG: hypothetical protein ABR976_17700 [Terracidiphilus sp.]